MMSMARGRALNGLGEMNQLICPDQKVEENEEFFLGLLVKRLRQYALRKVASVGLYVQQSDPSVGSLFTLSSTKSSDLLGPQSR
ncbi:hypothetical protein L2E82_43754 [Cichorium intybus]|uniref:Uncharacterized protein n=1 Tax=Cichorium intybus TaxID=13427 RepID=A0ACB8ZP39_CICIN|nr:hypothetical protein L2E82_43754 [Cichorium intybus]